ncbi:MAG: response regulator [Treponema sp.]|nr:response regulator [Treponema sp.]
MSKNVKPLIYIAESSRILSKVICSELKAAGYESQVFTDGFSLLKKIVSNSPALIIADKNLPMIDGVDLCYILKNGSSKNTIPFILISSDDTISDFWTSASGANKALAISSQNIDLLIDSVKKLLAPDYLEIEVFDANRESIFGQESDLTDNDKLISWLVTSLTKSEYYYTMIKNVIQLYSKVKDLNYLIENLFYMLYKACEYDAITLILDGRNTRVFKSGLENFSSQVADEFWNICKTDYEVQAKKNHSINYEEKVLTGILPSALENIDEEIEALEEEGEFEEASLIEEKNNPVEVKLESYTTFTININKDFVGTLHLASTKKMIFNYKVQSSIEFVLPALAAILQESVQRAELMLQETKLRSAFSKFVPEQVINTLLNSNKGQELKNNNEKRNVVILMSDIRNFTSISEVNKAEDVVNFLNNYFTHMVEIIKKYGGTVDKFIGDAIMVLFGAPISYNDNADRAVKAAIEMYAQLGSIPCGDLKFPEGMDLDIGIGIHYGDVIVGQIGSADKTNYTVIGDTVNLASRLEGLTKIYGAKVIISQAVRDELDEDMNILLLDSVKVKGKKESVNIYRIDAKALPKTFAQSYEKGLKSYNEGAFNLAIPYFKKAVKVIPQDKAAKLMLERCNEFLINPPENWDGAIALTSK